MRIIKIPVKVAIAKRDMAISRMLKRNAELYKPGRLGYGIACSCDKTLATLGLLVASPVMALIALGIKLESKGPVIFAQERIGQYGKKFKMYKFRTMGINSKNSPLGATNDARITGIGKKLRISSLDELPQLWNIIKGDMSFVGPRANYFGETENQLRAKSLVLNDGKIYRYWHRAYQKPGFTVPGYGNAKKLDGLGMTIDDVAKLKMSAEAPFVTNWTLKQYFQGLYNAAKKVVTGRNC